MTDTSASGRREANKARTRTALVESVFDLLEAEGPVALTTERVADAAGISRRTFFNYFPSVEAVLASAAEDVLDEIGGILRSRPGDEPLIDSVVEALAELFTLDFLRQSARIWQVVESIPGARRFALEADSDAAAALAATWAGDRLGESSGSTLHVSVLANSCLAAFDVARRDWLTRCPEDIDEPARADFLTTARLALNVIRPAVEGVPTHTPSRRLAGAR